MYTTIIIALVALVAGAAIGWTALQIAMKHRAQNIIKEAEAEAEVIKKDKILQAKEKFLQIKAEHDKQVTARNNKLQAVENKLKQQETDLTKIRRYPTEKQRDSEPTEQYRRSKRTD